MTLFHDILDFIIPPHCSICGIPLVRTEKAVCDECFNSIAVIVPPFCQRCGKSGQGSVCNDCILQPHGYNQCEILCREISEETGIPTITDALVQVRPTKPQKIFAVSGLSSAEQAALRRTNVEGAFGMKNADSVADKRIIIVDDVCTTGATLDECAREVYRAGAKEVYAAIVARAA